MFTITIWHHSWSLHVSTLRGKLISLQAVFACTEPAEFRLSLSLKVLWVLLQPCFRHVLVHWCQHGLFLFSQPLHYNWCSSEEIFLYLFNHFIWELRVKRFCWTSRHFFTNIPKPGTSFPSTSAPEHASRRLSSCSDIKKKHFLRPPPHPSTANRCIISVAVSERTSARNQLPFGVTLFRN